MGVPVTLFFFLNGPGGHTLGPILTQNGSNDVGSRTACLIINTPTTRSYKLQLSYTCTASYPTTADT